MHSSVVDAVVNELVLGEGGEESNLNLVIDFVVYLAIFATFLGEGAVRYAAKVRVDCHQFMYPI